MPRSVLYDKRLKSNDVMVYFQVANCIPDWDGLREISLDGIIKNGRMARSTAAESVANLVKCGHILIDGRKNSNRYALTDPIWGKPIKTYKRQTTKREYSNPDQSARRSTDQSARRSVIRIENYTTSELNTKRANSISELDIERANSIDNHNSENANSSQTATRSVIRNSKTTQTTINKPTSKDTKAREIKENGRRATILPKINTTANAMAFVQANARRQLRDLFPSDLSVVGALIGIKAAGACTEEFVLQSGEIFTDQLTTKVNQVNSCWKSLSVLEVLKLCEDFVTYSKETHGQLLENIEELEPFAREDVRDLIAAAYEGSFE